MRTAVLQDSVTRYLGSSPMLVGLEPRLSLPPRQRAWPRLLPGPQSEL